MDNIGSGGEQCVHIVGRFVHSSECPLSEVLLYRDRHFTYLAS